MWNILQFSERHRLVCRSLQMLRMNVLPPSSGLGNELNERRASRGGGFLRSVVKHLPDYTASHPRRQHSL
jgi:hypothetical protein